MSKNWSLFLVVAFVLGFALKSYLDLQGKVENEATPPTHCALCLFRSIQSVMTRSFLRSTPTISTQ